MDLMTCPFCTQHRGELVEVQDEPSAAYVVACMACGAHGPVEPSQQRAMDKWNQRGPAQA
jgi:Lar family restriction alleviation protein